MLVPSKFSKGMFRHAVSPSSVFNSSTSVVVGISMLWMISHLGGLPRVRLYLADLPSPSGVKPLEATNPT